MKSKKVGINRYNTFPLKREWFISFLQKEDFWKDNVLSRTQLDAFKKYLKDAGLLKPKGGTTRLFSLVKRLYIKKPNLVWQTVWINLVNASPLFRWFVASFPWNLQVSKWELVEKLSADFNLKRRTAENAVYSLVRTLKESPLGNWFGIEVKRNVFLKEGVKSELERYAVAYALYKWREEEGFSSTTISEIYSPQVSGGPHKWLGIPKRKLEKTLRSLRDEGIIELELVADLDNIHLKRELSPLKILEIAVREF